jgi:hypothetical protein
MAITWRMQNSSELSPPAIRVEKGANLQRVVENAEQAAIVCLTGTEDTPSVGWQDHGANETSVCRTSGQDGGRRTRSADGGYGGLQGLSCGEGSSSPFTETSKSVATDTGDQLVEKEKPPEPDTIAEGTNATQADADILEMERETAVDDVHEGPDKDQHPIAHAEDHQAGNHSQAEREVVELTWGKLLGLRQGQHLHFAGPGSGALPAHSGWWRDAERQCQWQARHGSGFKLRGRWWLPQETAGTMAGVECVWETDEPLFPLVLVSGGPWLLQVCC